MKTVSRLIWCMNLHVDKTGTFGTSWFKNKTSFVCHVCFVVFLTRGPWYSLLILFTSAMHGCVLKDMKFTKCICMVLPNAYACYKYCQNLQKGRGWFNHCKCNCPSYKWCSILMSHYHSSTNTLGWGFGGTSIIGWQVFFTIHGQFVRTILIRIQIRRNLFTHLAHTLAQFYTFRFRLSTLLMCIKLYFQKQFPVELSTCNFLRKSIYTNM